MLCLLKEHQSTRKREIIGLVHCALTIAGSDPTAGAGIQADIKTFAALGVYGLSAVTSVTAQNSHGVQGVHPVPPGFLNLQIASLIAEFQIDAVKTGMLYKKDLIEVCVSAVKKHGLKHLVLDPVIRASSGGDLLDPDAMDALKGRLFPVAMIVTPNLEEAALLTGMDIRDDEGMKSAAASIHAMGPDLVLIKGGHLKGRITDLLFAGDTYTFIPADRVPKDVHGTGCTLSAAIAAGLAKGLAPLDAVYEAHAYTQRIIRDAFSIGHGPCYADHLGYLDH